MKPNDRLLSVWNALIFYVVAPATMLSVVLGWPGAVQLTLTLVMLVAASVPPIVLARARRRR